MASSTPPSKPAHLVWSYHAQQHCYARAAVRERDPRDQCIKALHINVCTFLQLIGPSPPGPMPWSTAGVGAFMAPAVLRRHLPAAVVTPLPGGHAGGPWLLAYPRVALALQSAAIDGALRVLGGSWHHSSGAQQASLGPGSWLQRVARDGLAVLPERALVAAASRARFSGCASLAAGLMAAAALCPKLSFCLRLLRDGHRALCALPLAVFALALGLTVDLWLIGWRKFQGTSHTTESYLFAPCTPPAPLRGCWRAPPGAAQEAPPAPEMPGVQDEAHQATRLRAEATRLRAEALRHQVGTFLRLEHLFQAGSLSLGLFGEQVDVARYIEHTEALLLLADTPNDGRWCSNSANYARIKGPEVEAVGERWLAALRLPAAPVAPGEAQPNAKGRNLQLWRLKQAMALTGPQDERMPYLRHELRQAVDPKDFYEEPIRYSRKFSEPAEAGRSEQLRHFEATMAAVLPDLKLCFDISGKTPSEFIRPLLELLQKDAAFYERLTACRKEIDVQLKQKSAVDREGLKKSLAIWRQITSQQQPKFTNELRRLVHEDKLGAKRKDFAGVMDLPDLAQQDHEALRANTNTLYVFLYKLYGAARKADRLG